MAAGLVSQEQSDGRADSVRHCLTIALMLGLSVLRTNWASVKAALSYLRIVAMASTAKAPSSDATPSDGTTKIGPGVVRILRANSPVRSESE